MSAETWPDERSIYGVFASVIINHYIVQVFILELMLNDLILFLKTLHLVSSSYIICYRSERLLVYDVKNVGRSYLKIKHGKT